MTVDRPACGILSARWMIGGRVPGRTRGSKVSIREIHGQQFVRLKKRVQQLCEASPLRSQIIAGLTHGLLSVMAAILAYLPTRAIGLQDGFWSAITAITVAQTEYQAMRSTARDQFIGAAVGGVVALACYVCVGQGLWSYALAVVISVLGSSLINVQSAKRLAAVTTTIILLVPHTGSPQRMMISRLSEVGWGIAVAASLVWLATRLGLVKRNDD